VVASTAPGDDCQSLSTTNTWPLARPPPPPSLPPATCPLPSPRCPPPSCSCPPVALLLPSFCPLLLLLPSCCPLLLPPAPLLSPQLPVLAEHAGQRPLLIKLAQVATHARGARLGGHSSTVWARVVGVCEDGARGGWRGSCRGRVEGEGLRQVPPCGWLGLCVAAPRVAAKHCIQLQQHQQQHPDVLVAPCCKPAGRCWSPSGA
jgi:hypothetical protein